MKIFQKIFGKTPDLPFQVGDKVRDLEGAILLVTEVNPQAENGLGIIRTRNAAGQESITALITTHHFILVEKNTPLSSPSFVPKRIKPEDLAASAYLRSNMIVLHGVCQTNMGGFNCEPYRTFETTISDLVLGTELLHILKEAGATPVPASLKEEQKKIFSVCKVRSWSALCENALQCGIEQTAEQISFLPTQRDGRAFHHKPDLTIRIGVASTPEETGKALRSCFQVCS
jgi:CDI immunity protein